MTGRTGYGQDGNMGVTGRPGEAGEIAGQLAGQLADRLNGEGLALAASGRAGAARRAWRQALALAPDCVPALGNLGNQEAEAGPLDRACRTYLRALALAPGLAALHLMLGTARLKSGRDAEGEAALARALQLAPGYPKAHFNLGIHWLNRGRLAEAEAALRQVLAGDAGNALALAGLAQVLSRSGRTRAARGCVRRALALAPSAGEALAALGQLGFAGADAVLSTRGYRRAEAVSAAGAAAVYAVKNLMLALHYDPRASSAEIYALHRRWAELQPRPDPANPDPANDPAKDGSASDGFPNDPGRRLRLGYLSADLYDHPVGRNVLGLIEHHDRDRFEVHLYDARLYDAREGGGDLAGDAVAARLRAAATSWRPVAGLDDAALAGLIRRERIDLLVILAGHTKGNRIAVAARRPAPVQASLHDLSTSGLDQVDYVFSDAVLAPADGSGPHDERFSEQVVRLPCFYLQAPLPDVRMAGPLAGRSPEREAREGLVLGCSGNPAKLNDRVIALWARVLEALPEARLTLKYHDAFADPGLVEDIAERFAGRGQGRARLAFDGRRGDAPAHLAAIAQFDIALDPFPFNGSTTTYEALWMGVPVVTLAGRRFLGRVGEMMLRQVGLGDLVAADEAAYVAAVVALARDADRRRHLRGDLRGRLLASAMLDAAGYARSVEAAYLRMWREGRETKKRNNE